MPAWNDPGAGMLFVGRSDHVLFQISPHVSYCLLPHYGVY